MNAFRRPGTGRRIITRTLAATAVAAVLFGGAGVTAAGAAEAESYDEQQVAAIAESGVVYIGIEWSGFVQYPIDGGEYEWSNRVTTAMACSGFVADSSGYVVTAGHCADPAEGRRAIILQFLRNLVDKDVLTEQEAIDLAPRALNNWLVEGKEAAAPIDRTVTVYRSGAASSVQVTEEFTAKVIENRPLGEGDVTLLKVQTNTPLPELHLAEGDVEVGEDVAAVGFPGSVGAVVDPGVEPSFKTGRASAHQTYQGSPFVQIDAAVTGGMSGGPVVDMHGDVVGIVSFGPNGEEQAFNFAAALETVQSLLARNGVDTELDAADQAFRDGLTSYYAGDYATATDSFDTVLQVTPSHAQAQEFRSKAAQELASQGGSTAQAAERAGSGAATTAAADTATQTSTGAPRQTSQVTSSEGGVPLWVWAAGIVGTLVLAALIIVGLGRRRDGRSAPAPTTPPAPQAPVTAPFAPAPDLSVPCRHCGSPVSGRFCTGCGTANDPADMRTVSMNAGR